MLQIMLLFFNHLIVNKTFFSINPFFLFLHGFLVFKLNSIKKMRIIVVLTVSLLMLSFCKNTEKENNKNDVATVDVTKNKKNEKTKIFTSEKYKFSVDFISEPQVETMQTKGTNELGLTMFMVEGEDCGYFVAVTDLKDKISDKEKLEANLDNMLQSAKGAYTDLKTITEKEIKLGSVSGREFEGKGKIGQEDLYYRVQLFISGKRIYQVYCIAGSKNVPKRKISKFINSFEIL